MKRKALEKKKKYIEEKEEITVIKKDETKLESNEDTILIKRVLDVITKSMFKLTLLDSVYFQEARKQLIMCLRKHKAIDEDKERLINYRNEWNEMKKREQKKEHSMIKANSFKKPKRTKVEEHEAKMSVAEAMEKRLAEL